MREFNFTEEQLERYSRHILLPEVGGKGQQKLLESSVLLLGAGGLGSPAGLYLAAAGVGHIGIVDSDTVDLSNLQRQIIHRTRNVGVPKTESAKKGLERMNPDIRVTTHNLRISADNILDVIRDYDYVVEGSDNFPTKFLVNDACVLVGKPFSIAGILRFVGQIMTIIPRKGPCYRCVFHEPPPPGQVPTCQEAGVLGAVAGIMGVAQATEIIKMILGIGTSLIGNIMVFDALEMNFRKVPVKMNTKCPVCGENPTIKKLEDYHLACEIMFKKNQQ